MKMERKVYKGWDAIFCQAGSCELIIGVSAGPRILSFGYAGKDNLLYYDTTDFKVGDWKLYGGHRFTTAPESEESYIPDNLPCEVDCHDLSLKVSVTQGCLRKTIHIGAAADGAGFDVLHILQNYSKHTWQGALWAITCVPPVGKIVGTYSHPHVQEWPGTSAAMWQQTCKHISVAAGSRRGKIGWYSNPAWIASVQVGNKFIIYTPHPPALADCVDGGCNIEVFTCENYSELETLSGKVVLAPGNFATHLQCWRLLSAQI
jgi:hypothetical protein